MASAVTAPAFPPASRRSAATFAALRRANGILCGALIAACAADARTLADASFSEHYFDGLSSSPLAACAPVVGGDLAGRSLDMSLFFGPGADDETVVAEGSRLQRFFAPYGLGLRAAGAASATPLRYAMDGTAAQLDAAFEQIGLPPDAQLTEAQWRQASRAVGAVIFADLRAFVRSHTAGAGVNMVVLEHVLSPALSQYLFGADGPKIIGFTVSPTLFRQVDATDPEYDLWQMTGLPADFAPTSFIGDADVGDLPGSADNLVAHEVGHALGLPHASEPGNVMTPGQNLPCDEALSSNQLAEILQTLLHNAGRADPTRHIAVAQAFDFIPRVVDAALAARQSASSGRRSVPASAARNGRCAIAICAPSSGS